LFWSFFFLVRARPTITHVFRNKFSINADDNIYLRSEFFIRPSPLYLHPKRRGTYYARARKKGNYRRRRPIDYGYIKMYAERYQVDVKNVRDSDLDGTVYFLHELPKCGETKGGRELVHVPTRMDYGGTIT